MKNIMIILLTFTMTMSCVTFGSTQVFAHDVLLDVEYDDCINNQDNDGIFEAWYDLEQATFIRHIDDDIDTIYYYFEDEPNGATWSTCLPSASRREAVQKAYASSMEKWNNVLFYSYDAMGNVVKQKLIHVTAGTQDNHNLSIYPQNNELIEEIAATGFGYRIEDFSCGDAHHYHYSDLYMYVNVPNFYVHDTYSEDFVETVREQTGAHELGHVLGLADLDKTCSAASANDHHGEVIMGYGDMDKRTHNISYKDIAGAAIARGLHTDNDHKWLLSGTQNGKYKLICSICNGVRWTDTLAGYVYKTYNQCDQQHELSSNNMMAVASYGDRDYYKCKYCRYVAPFDERVPQNYTVTSVNSTYHKYTNIVPGLGYTFLEEHDMTIHGCLTCGYAETSHTFGRYLYLNGNEHRRACTCGKTETQAHSVLYDEIENGRYANCLGCKARLDLTKDNANIAHGITNMRTANGSYILPNGIVVLVQADLEAYENGTLQFYNVGEQTQTE